MQAFLDFLVGDSCKISDVRCFDNRQINSDVDHCEVWFTFLHSMCLYFVLFPIDVNAIKCIINIDEHENDEINRPERLQNTSCCCFRCHATIAIPGCP